jgi:D-arabinose 1-dehydrogenase-like Zn-dependent alcohol dehydrogenase
VSFCLRYEADVGSLYASVKDAEEMISEIEDHPVQVIKRIFELEEINEAVEISKRGGKIVIEFVKEEID